MVRTASFCGDICRRLTGSAVVSLSGLAMLGIATVVEHITDPPPTDVVELKKCIEGQFVKNGFRISSSNTTRFDGYVAGIRSPGPPVTLTFDSNHVATLAVPNGVLPTEANVLYSLGHLSGDVTGNCLRRTARQFSTLSPRNRLQAG
jgi:hypothetical protein